MELLGSKPLHNGKHVDFVAKRYRRADGSEVEREVVEHPGSVAVLAYDEEFAYLVAQPREAVEDDELLESPAGAGRGGGAAGRELGAGARHLPEPRLPHGGGDDLRRHRALGGERGARRGRGDRDRPPAAGRDRPGTARRPRRDHGDRAAMAEGAARRLGAVALD